MTVRLSSPTTEEEEDKEDKDKEDENKEEDEEDEDERGSSEVTVHLSSPTTGSISSSATTQVLMKACTCEPVPASIRLTLEHPRHPLWMECPFIWTLTSRLQRVPCGTILSSYGIKLGFKCLPSLLLMVTCVVKMK